MRHFFRGWFSRDENATQCFGVQSGSLKRSEIMRPTLEKCPHLLPSFGIGYCHRGNRICKRNSSKAVA